MSKSKKQKKKEKLEAAKAPDEPTPKLPRRLYEAELLRLQEELVVLADWVKREKARVLVVFEGRDAAGKGGVIKRISEYMPPPRRPRRRAAGADRAGAGPVVLPALRGAAAGGR